MGFSTYILFGQRPQRGRSPVKHKGNLYICPSVRLCVHHPPRSGPFSPKSCPSTPQQGPLVPQPGSCPSAKHSGPSARLSGPSARLSSLGQRPQRGQSQVEHRGNLYVCPSVRLFIHPSLGQGPSAQNQAPQCLCQALWPLSPVLSSLSQALAPQSRTLAPQPGSLAPRLGSPALGSCPEGDEVL